ncbi:hypothetical protein EUAN_15540 [Andreesenia angusta]|uniref:UPF0251 protein EUAN_15540 n=1 Tax=Andreesenia angusta TaxID=39480 RepID=A0A1S1V640_9FIRM|nr:DUF134 domain-containing protein [Andreesenia angusta]OHW62106.1 hypothetical protein EUAN_15540 [Andreesenia angusta]
MARPVKMRRVEFFPDTSYFIPAGKPKCKVEEMNLKVEELEAMRLKDIEGLNQEECAEQMGVSRQTFQNIIDSARKKVAIALTEGFAISIGGGNYTSKHCSFTCRDCGHEYEAGYEQDKVRCPACGSEEIACNKRGAVCKKHCIDKKFRID